MFKNTLFSSQVPAVHTPNGTTDPRWRMFTIPCPRIESKEDIYDDLCYVTFQATLPEVRYMAVLDFVPSLRM